MYSGTKGFQPDGRMKNKEQMEGINIKSWLAWAYSVHARIFSSWPAAPSYPCRHMVNTPSTENHPLPLDYLISMPQFRGVGSMVQRD